MRTRRRGDDVLVRGDAIDDALLGTRSAPGIPAYVSSIRRLAELDVVAGHGGHDPSFSGDRMRETAEDYLPSHPDVGRHLTGAAAAAPSVFTACYALLNLWGLSLLVPTWADRRRSVSAIRASGADCCSGVLG